MIKLGMLLICLTTWMMAFSCDTQAEPAVSEKVVLQLKWQHQFQFAGYYAAQAMGYYRDAGLEVDIQEATAGSDTLQRVLSGQAQYGVGTSSLILKRHEGLPVVVLAVIFQHSPLVFLARQDASLSTIHDLGGKRVMIEPLSDELLAYLKKEGVQPETLLRVAHSFKPADLLDGKVDAISAYITDEPFFLERARFPFLSFTPRSVGIDFYGDNLYTTEQELKSHPGRVQAFRAASLKGWQYAMQHPEEIAELIIQRYGERHGKDYLLFEAKQMQPLIQPELVEMGYMNPGRWQHIAATYGELGMLPENFSLAGFLYEPNPASPLHARLILALIILGGVLLVLMGIAWQIGRLNRRLRQAALEQEAVETRLRESEARYRVFFETAPSAGIVWTEGFLVTDWNQRAEALFGWKREAVLGRNFFDFMIPPLHRREMEIKLAGMLGTSPCPYGIDTNLTQDGRIITCEWFSAWLPDVTGHPRETISLATDITQRQATEAALRASRLLLKESFESLRDHFSLFEVLEESPGLYHYRLVECNQAMCRFLGLARESVLGRELDGILSRPDLRVGLEARYRQVVVGRHFLEFEENVPNAAGQLCYFDTRLTPIFDEGARVSHIAGISRDITERQVAALSLQEINQRLAQQLAENSLLQARLQEQAIRDSLTGLFNRRYLDETLDLEIAQAKRLGTPLSVVMLDLDHFKRVNDTYGHQAGDEVLKALGHLLQEDSREGDILCRYGGEEFLLVFPGMPLEAAVERAERWRERFAALQVVYGTLTMQATFSAGVAYYPRHGASRDELLERVDEALYQAKHLGRNRVEVAAPPTLAGG